MKFNGPIFFTLMCILLSWSCETKDPTENLYMCKCTEKSPDSIKTVYTFLVTEKDEEDVDCCTSSVHELYPGILENWRRDTTGTDQWAISDTARTEILATQAQEEGCAMKDKEITKADVRKMKEDARKYYPNLTFNE